MKITEVRLGMISVPLRVPFKTALRSVNSVEDVVVEIHTDTGAVGYGEAPPTGVITGDTTGAIIGAMKDHIIKTLVGRDVDDFESVTKALNGCIVHNTSARAAADMALWDLYGQLHNIPVYKLLGGGRSSIVTDITISVNKPEEMQRDAINAVERGYDCLKVKVGSDPSLDVARLSAIREFTQFGAGFKIAMRDLEIRGAGNLLGPEQHGHMAAVGYDLYCKIVEGAVKEAKGEKEPVKIDTVVDIPVPASISTHYIPRESERLSMYKRIALIETRDDLSVSYTHLTLPTTERV